MLDVQQLVFVASVTIAVGVVTAIGTTALAVTAFAAYRSNQKLVDAAKAQATAVEQQSKQVARQAAAVEQQARAAAEQAEVARLALARQQEPHLVPAGPKGCRVGELIETQAGPQMFRTRRVFLDIENAGFGVATIVGAEAQSRERGTYNVWAPPAVPPGGKQTLQLTPPGGVPLDPPTGERIEVTVQYAGVSNDGLTLRFDATYYPGGDWHVQLANSKLGRSSRNHNSEPARLTFPFMLNPVGDTYP